MSAPQPTIPFPCYAIMSNNCQGGVVLPRDDGSVAMALFTSEDKVRKFRAANAPQMFAGPSVKFDWDHELLLYLNHLPPAVTHIGVDAEKVGGMVLFIPVSEMKAEIRKRLDDKSQP
jgi:hypothetical protein